MKQKPNWSEIESRTDFGSVNLKLEQFATSGAGRRKTVADLLDKVNDALLQARGSGVSYRALAAFLKENGMPVSEPLLRQYLRRHGANKTRATRAPAGKPGAQRAAANASPALETREQKAPVKSAPYVPKVRPLAETDPWEHQGPRIADPSTL
jgi:hypothetical protein